MKIGQKITPVFLHTKINIKVKIGKIKTRFKKTRFNTKNENRTKNISSFFIQ